MTKIAIAAGVAVLPTLLAGRAGKAALLAPAVAALAYAIYRENTKPGDSDARRLSAGQLRPKFRRTMPPAEG